MNRRRSSEGEEMGRAGQWARQEARRRHLEFARSQWRLLTLLAAMTVLAFVPFFLVAGPFGRGVVVGALATALPLGFYVLAVVVVGTGGTLAGAAAAQWTADELKKVRQRGWESADEVPSSRGDIDHVLVGPGGVVAIETKSSGYRWSLGKDSAHVARAADQAWEGARRVRLVLRNAGLVTPVSALVVAWGKHDTTVRANHGTVSVVAGSELGSWLDEFSQRSALSPEEVQRAMSAISAYVDDLDGKRREKVSALVEHGPVELIVRGWQTFAGFVGAASIAGYAIETDTAAVYGPVVVALLVAGVVARSRFPLFRHAALGWIASSGLLAVLLVLAVSASFLGW